MVAIFLFVLIIGFLVVIHELGHLATAKLFKVDVKEFGIGFPPRIFEKHYGATKYSLNAIPLGGFVRLAGEDDASIPNSLASKSPLIRAIILVSGSLVNIGVAVIIFSALFTIPTAREIGTVTITHVEPRSPAALIYLEPGDIIRSLDGHRIVSIHHLSRRVNLNLGKSTEMIVERDGNLSTNHIIPRWLPPTNEGPIGIAVEMLDRQIIHDANAPWKAVPLAINHTAELLTLAKNEIYRMILARGSFPMMGPVGIAHMTGEVAGYGPIILMQFVALLSLNLGIVNLFPIPALDGGRLLFVLLESLRGGKKVSTQRERMIHFLGFITLIVGVGIISYYDILRISGGGTLIR